MLLVTGFSDEETEEIDELVELTELTELEVVEIEEEMLTLEELEMTVSEELTLEVAGVTDDSEDSLLSGATAVATAGGGAAGRREEDFMTDLTAFGTTLCVLELMLTIVELTDELITSDSRISDCDCSEEEGIGISSSKICAW